MSTKTSHIIVGLGNPGPTYSHNRHNIGFMVLDKLAAVLGMEFDAGNDGWQEARRLGIVLLKPQWYMNRSGEALAAWAAATGVSVTGRPAEASPAEDIATTGDQAGEVSSNPPVAPDALRPLVVCDDLALPLGAVRLRARGSSGGQNGLGDIIEQLGGPEVPRLRLGIAPSDVAVDASQWPDYVLADFGVEEHQQRDEMVDHAVAALRFWLEGDLEGTISRFNRRSAPDAGNAD